MSTPKTYDILDQAAIPAGEVPQARKKLDVHGALYRTDTRFRSPRIGFALGRENPSEFVVAFLPVPEISVVKESGWDGPFSSPTYSIYATTETKTWAYEEGRVEEGMPACDKPGRTRFYYGADSKGYWRRWSELRAESGAFVFIRRPEIPRLRDDFGFGMVMWMGIGGWSVLWEPETEGRWIVEVGGRCWASDDWEPGDGLPYEVNEDYDRARKELCEIMLGREITEEEFESLGVPQ